MNKELKTKMELEVLKTIICVNKETTQDELWLQSDTPHMHKHFLKRLDSNIKTYVKRLKTLLVPNKEYILDLGNSTIPYDEKDNFVQFLYDNMVYADYKGDYDEYHYDIDSFDKTNDEHKSEIIEILHLSILTFYVDDNGNTIINGLFHGFDSEIVNVKVSKNIFDTDLIADISLVSL